ncbi:MAG TPA: hypothetical protein VFS50_17910 [Meiothermus sp.]|nr:hypothetical protein [Meiothermus sp.]
MASIRRTASIFKGIPPRGLILLLFLGCTLFAGWPRPAPQPVVSAYSLRQILDDHPAFRLEKPGLGAARREAVVARYLSVKASTEMLLGQEAARAVARLLRLEFYNQALQQRSAFSTPEAALEVSERWLAAIGALERGHKPGLAGLPLDSSAVIPHWTDLQAAANTLGLPVGVLAAIVDNEQYGGNKALGLARGLREVADGLAQGLAETTGSAGSAGLLSRTLGLAQMSWEDALKQEKRLRHFRAWNPQRPFPKTEAEARAALENPYLNLLFTASRLRGYLNDKLYLSPRDTRPLWGAWLYYLGPAWHNWPPGADEATWPYAFHAFFKGLLYQVVFSDPDKAALLPGAEPELSARGPL